MNLKSKKIGVLGFGNIGYAIVKGFLQSEAVNPNNLIVTKRNLKKAEKASELGIELSDNNKLAVKKSEIIILAVTPNQLGQLLDEIKKELDSKKHKIFSVVSGVSISKLKKIIGKEITIVRVMPNTAIMIGESMTCISSSDEDKQTLSLAKKLFDHFGKTLVISEELMVPATVLGACGIAFFMRAIRAASQGGIEIGFHAEEALLIAAQTAKGAASILLTNKTHPENEVDKVTTPQGCTIAGLNEMEHHGFSSSLIKGIVTSAEKCSKLS